MFNYDEFFKTLSVHQDMLNSISPVIKNLSSYQAVLEQYRPIIQPLTTEYLSQCNGVVQQLQENHLFSTVNFVASNYISGSMPSSDVMQAYRSACSAVLELSSYIDQFQTTPSGILIPSPPNASGNPPNEIHPPTTSEPPLPSKQKQLSISQALEYIGLLLTILSSLLDLFCSGSEPTQQQMQNQFDNQPQIIEVPEDCSQSLEEFIDLTSQSLEKLCEIYDLLQEQSQANQQPQSLDTPKSSRSSDDS